MSNFTSFTQDQKHATKSERFIAIKPSEIGDIFKANNFEMIHLKGGKARIDDRQDFQTTISRYRSKDNFNLGNGLHLDIIMKAPHLYGSIEMVLGFFRMQCANQLNVGQRFLTIKIPHTGQVEIAIQNGINELLNQRYDLKRTIESMQATNLTDDQSHELARKIAMDRINKGAESIKHVHTNYLLKSRRYEDQGNDLFTVLNRIQENVLKTGVHYVESKNTAGLITLSNEKTKAIKDNTKTTIDLNSMMFDHALSFVS